MDVNDLRLVLRTSLALDLSQMYKPERALTISDLLRSPDLPPKYGGGRNHEGKKSGGLSTVVFLWPFIFNY